MPARNFLVRTALPISDALDAEAEAPPSEWPSARNTGGTSRILVFGQFQQRDYTPTDWAKHFAERCVRRKLFVSQCSHRIDRGRPARRDQRRESRCYD
jgi:hypothetical protein